jgi:hypothetical protein
MNDKYEIIPNPEHEYVIIHTGYASRISKYGHCNKKFFRTLKEHLDIDEKDQEMPVKLLFVYDHIWGDDLGLPKDVYNNGLIIDEDTEQVHNLIDDLKELNLLQNGIACFKCNQDNYLSLEKTILSGIYCCAFDVTKTVLYKGKEAKYPTIKYVEIDAESG